jgi:hypothetical protein
MEAQACIYAWGFCMRGLVAIRRGGFFVANSPGALRGVSQKAPVSITAH